jgi:histidinol dehydrogenase
MPQMLDTRDPGFEAAFAALLSMKREDSPDVDDAVAAIIAEVRARGDAALVDLTARFDRVTLTPATLRFSREEIDALCARVDPADAAALAVAADRIRAYHERQLPDDAQWTDSTGATLGWRWTPVAAAGLYVPGGLASYPSSVLMNAIPARVAGVERLAICVPTPGGEANPLVLCAARLAGVDEVYRIGGAQAIAALAWGTATIAPVDKITGPGNAYVAAAKRRVFGRVGIDMIAGPSEILVIADRDNDPDWIALDLLSQAEHDESAQSLLITDDAAFGQAVAAAVDRALESLPRRAIAGASWRDFGAVIIVRDLAEAAALSDRIAPEHLELCVADPDALLSRIRHAGAIFLGAWTPEAIGDYVGGPNHVLPTARSARFSSGLSVLDFMKRTTLARMTPGALATIGPAAETLARAESLQAHGLSVRARLDRLNGGGA